MKKYDRFSLTLFFISICAAILSVAARIFLTANFLEADKHGVYMRGTLLPTAYHIMLVLFIAALALTAIIKGRKNTSPTLVSATNLTVFTSCVSAFLILAYAFFFVWGIAKSDASAKITDVLTVASLVPTVIFFFLLAFQKGERTPALAITALFPAVWAAIETMRIYFNIELLMNNPDKILGEFTFIITMLFFLVEARNQIGIPLKGFYRAAALTAPILLLTASIPNLVCADKLSDGSPISTIKYMLCIALALFIYSRALAHSAMPAVENTSGEANIE